jgi:hypothetical protein
MDHVVEKAYHGVLICCPCIFQAEWHDFVEVSSSRRDKSCLLHIV